MYLSLYLVRVKKSFTYYTWLFTALWKTYKNAFSIHFKLQLTEAWSKKDYGPHNEKSSSTIADFHIDIAHKLHCL